MSTTIAELSLSPAYRLAQRAVASWLERGQAGARQAAFAARAALASLDTVERSRLARWLAWLAVAAHSRGEESPQARVGRLDASLHQAMEDALARLPAGMLGSTPKLYRRSAWVSADTAPRMTSVNRAR
ncbi:MAG TPA: hypothetical protein VFG49_16595 [Dyella sp.]|uniref:hypothetical protein n=1 Tax=Dyella sp. TaxID=1869338 RepID=UPI002D768512|nr:hypothetical protein [Dyella sp.]HET6555146.1 hypothetical protein [Dyella sp.]